jgi:poly(A) polymerase
VTGAEPARRIEPPVWSRRPAIRAIHDALGSGRFVGGAVRDTLLGRPVGDIDLATPLTPDAVIHRLELAGIRAVPTGLAHGTVTAIADGQAVEVTTLRRDVATDGRHAVVEYTDDWAADAARRDFTMNALYLDQSGGVWDPAGGLADCLSGRVRFVGEPGRRIQEDRLRVLRFYRFQAHYGRGPADPAARAACRAATGELGLLSGERIRAELFKLLAAPDPAPTLRVMAADGVLRAVLPGPASPDRLAQLTPLEPAADPLRRLAALLPPNRRGAADLADKLRLSNRDTERLVDLVSEVPPIDLDADAAGQRAALYRLGPARYRDRVLLKAAASGRVAPVPLLLALAEIWREIPLPVDGADAIALGVPEGPRIGALLRTLEQWWIAQDFRPDRESCLAHLAELAAQAPPDRPPVEQ